MAIMYWQQETTRWDVNVESYNEQRFRALLAQLHTDDSTVEPNTAHVVRSRILQYELDEALRQWDQAQQ